MVLIESQWRTRFDEFKIRLDEELEKIDPEAISHGSAASLEQLQSKMTQLQAGQWPRLNVALGPIWPAGAGKTDHTDALHGCATRTAKTSAGAGYGPQREGGGPFSSSSTFPTRGDQSEFRRALDLIKVGSRRSPIWAPEIRSKSALGCGRKRSIPGFQRDQRTGSSASRPSNDMANSKASRLSDYLANTLALVSRSGENDLGQASHCHGGQTVERHAASRHGVTVTGDRWHERYIDNSLQQGIAIENAVADGVQSTCLGPISHRSPSPRPARVGDGRQQGCFQDSRYHTLPTQRLTRLV